MMPDLLLLGMAAAVLALPASAGGIGATCTMPAQKGMGVRFNGGRTIARDLEISSPGACCAACMAAGSECVGWMLMSPDVASPPSCRLKGGSANQTGGGSAGILYPCALCPYSGMAPAPPPPTCPPQRPSPPPPASTPPPMAAGGRGPNGARPHVFMFLQDGVPPLAPAF